MKHDDDVCVDEALVVSSKPVASRCRRCKVLRSAAEAGLRGSLQGRSNSPSVVYGV